MITIAPYDPMWPAKFDTEAMSIRRLLGEHALRVEHVGSTAVPGLAAKPIVDIQISVRSLASMDIFVEPLSRIGYRHIALGAFDLVYPFFQKPAVLPGTHHVHLCVVGSEQERRHLAFRDTLRNHPSLAAEYVTLKRQLALAHHGDNIASLECYSLAKSEFVNSVLERALAPSGFPADLPAPNHLR